MDKKFLNKSLNPLFNQLFELTMKNCCDIITINNITENDRNNRMII